MDADQVEIVAQICRALDGLPLAIELAAARVRSFSLTEIAEQVRADPTRLSRVGRPRHDHRQSLYEAMEWSYRLLTEQEQALHRRLSVLPGPLHGLPLQGRGHRRGGPGGVRGHRATARPRPSLPARRPLHPAGNRHPVRAARHRTGARPSPSAGRR